MWAFSFVSVLFKEFILLQQRIGCSVFKNKQQKISQSYLNSSTLSVPTNLSLANLTLEQLAGSMARPWNLQEDPVALRDKKPIPQDLCIEHLFYESYPS